MGLPAVVLPDATRVFQNGESIEVNGNQGWIARASAVGETPRPASFYGRVELHTRKSIREWALGSLCTDKPAKLGAA